MSARLTAFVVWAAVAASAMFWLLRLVSSSPSAPAHTVTVAAATTVRGDLARVLGAPPQLAAAGTPVATEPALASRFKLLGVAAPRQGGEQVGVALIAVDGKPARGYRVGAPVDGPIVLQSVSARGASLGPTGAAPQLTLELPALPAPATSSRPPGASMGAGAPVAPGLALPGTGPIGTAPPPMVPAPMPVQVPTAGAESQEARPVLPPPGAAAR
jgi:general secretion pathway protein C